MSVRPSSSVQTEFQAWVILRWQLRRSAGQTCETSSCSQPGNSDHGTGRQRLSGIWGTPVDEAGADATAPTWALGPDGRKDGVPQETKKITIPIHAMAKRKRDMGMILLEALAAGGILVLIVWWTMFSGRDKGEPKKPDQSD